MTKSNVPTPYILVRATSNFDGDPCDFAIFDISQTILSELKGYVSAVNNNELTRIRGYDSSTFFYNIHGYYRTGAGCLEDELRQIVGSAEWTFVNTSEEELEGFEIPESELDNEKIEVWSSGSFRFTAIADGTETRFETSEIRLSDIENFF